MLRKISVAAVIVVLILGTLTACKEEKRGDTAQSTTTVRHDDEASTTSKKVTIEIINDNYKNAYLEIIDTCEKESSEELVYNLIYVDDNDIPELVVGVNSYYVNMYTYSNGKVYTLMDYWGYGAAGNAGYEYSPRKNSLRNYNTDYAGAILYTTYMTVSDKHSIDTVAEIKTVNFDDSNNNGALDENEEGSVGNYSVSYLNGVEIKGDEDRAYDVGGYEYIYGIMNLEEIKAKLN